MEQQPQEPPTEHEERDVIRQLQQQIQEVHEQPQDPLQDDEDDPDEDKEEDEEGEEDDDDLEQIPDEWDPQQHHGDIMRNKEENQVRVISAQLNTFPTSNRLEDKAKLLVLRSLLVNSEADVMITQEDNVDWTVITAERRPKERCRSWFESLNVHSAFNTHEDNLRRKKLQGGVSIWTMNDATRRIESRGVDSSGLGRWNYVRYEGRNGVKTRIYSIYRPVSYTHLTLPTILLV